MMPLPGGVSVSNAESALIGCCLIDPECVEHVRQIVQPDHFTNDALRAIYRCILRVADQGLAVDYVTVLDEAEWSGVLERWGKTPDKRSAIVTATINCAPTSRHATSYAQVIRNHANQRNGEPRMPPARKSFVL